MKPANMFIIVGIAFVLLVLAAVAVLNTAGSEFYGISSAGFIKVDAAMNGSDLLLTGNCRKISMTISEHQALSIETGLKNEHYMRPLTHDIMKDIFTNFGIQLMDARIDSYTDGVYNARMFVKSGDKILEIDARPTDAVGMAVRMGVPLYFNEELLELNGEKVC